MCLPIISGGISISMMDNIRDVNHFAPKHTLPTLVFNAGKDKIVDIKGALDFYKKIKTPDDMKQNVQFYDCYH